jgi:hypothetical protein
MSDTNVFPIDPERFRLKSNPKTQSPAPDAPEAPQHPRGQRIPRQVEAFVMVPISAFTRESVRDVFGPRERLYLLLLHLSRRGQKPVKLTTAAVESIGLSSAGRKRCLNQLEAARRIVVERDGNRAAVVRVVVVSG